MDESTLQEKIFWKKKGYFFIVKRIGRYQDGSNYCRLLSNRTKKNIDRFFLR